MRCRATSPLVAFGSPTEPPQQRSRFTLPPKTVPSRDGASAATGTSPGGDIKRRPEIANPTGVDTEVVSDIRHWATSVLGTTSTKSLEQPASLGGVGQVTSRRPTMACPMFGDESSKALLREPSIESDIMCDDHNDRGPAESWTRQSILLFRFITRQQCQCGFSEHHYVDGPISTIHFDNEALIQRFDIRTTGHSERHTQRYLHLLVRHSININYKVSRYLMTTLFHKMLSAELLVSVCASKGRDIKQSTKRSFNIYVK
jgi:hypothetical protein